MEILEFIVMQGKFSQLYKGEATILIMFKSIPGAPERKSNKIYYKSQNQRGQLHLPVLNHTQCCYTKTACFSKSQLNINNDNLLFLLVLCIF